MINLLPPNTKKQLRAARVNVILLNYCLLIGLTALLLGGVFAVGFWADSNDQQLAAQAKTQSDSAAQSYGTIRKEAETFAKDLGVAKTILTNNVNFSQLILDIAGVVPSGVILNNLSLGTSSQNAPIDVNGRAVSYDAAVSLKNSLDASPIFENVNIVSINQIDTSTLVDPTPETLRYPFVINLKAQFSKKPAEPAKKEGA
jgi:Tfp pilus assembly protein PilN